MFETLKRLHDTGKLNEQGLQNAVTKGWITLEEYNQIINEGETTTE
ncbi:XkdX family protein [Paenibacillus camelliae]|nr:XkdX family protein [Paenibacillus camelliae]MCM3632921.1 XkdX family protein [Paenibacillus camelliae]